MKPCLSIDLGGTKIAAALVSHAGEITQRTQIATPQAATPEHLKLALAEIVVPFAGLADRLAVASTGIIDNGNLTALNPANLGGLNNFPLADEFQRLTGLTAVTINDAQAAAWAEYRYLSSQSSDVCNMAFITVSTGVGGGIISRGKLLTGKHGIAGHIGHIMSDPHGPECGCGRIGCVEAIASGRAIAAAANGHLSGYESPEIFERANAGDEEALALVNRSAAAIAQLAADMKMILDLDCIVIGGSVGLATGYLNKVRQYHDQLPEIFQVPLKSAHYRQDAGLLGAAMWAQEKR